VRYGLLRKMVESFRGGIYVVDGLRSTLELLMNIGIHLHITPSELNTPTPNNGSIISLITSPEKRLLKSLRRRMGIPVRTFLVVIKVCSEDELGLFRSAKNAEYMFHWTDFDVLRLGREYLRCDS
jgi:hypothetical protein